MNKLLSVIIPFRKRSGDRASIERLDQAIACFADQPDIELVVFDTGRQSTRLKLTNGQQDNLRYFHQYQPGVFAPGQVRNAAVAHATGQYIFLFDADLLISREMIDQLSGFVRELSLEGPLAFRMFPCLYLSQRYSAHFTAEFFKPVLQQALYQEAFESWFRGEVCKVDGIALASSCLLINREWFLAIGGFRQAFAGHGYEDFDLIHRLAMYYPVGKRPADYPVDVKSQFPGDYRGFRRYFSYYAVPHLFNGSFLLHQWHPRPLTRQYHRKRKENEACFAEILKDATVTLPEPLPGFQADAEILAVLKNGVFDSDTVLSDFPCWLREQQILNGFPVEEYPGLFHFQAGVRKKNGGFWRKLRKLILNPRAFFQDSMFIRKNYENP
ncbi:glycosyltransferase [Endozoicomonas sp. ALD040]|uniref:glycosyltransferase n=1 Tax=Endozoicomonas sp. ALD040 TaxID=3403079 RepID=UPI003BB19AD6